MVVKSTVSPPHSRYLTMPSRAVHEAKNKTNAKVDSVANDMVAGHAYPPALRRVCGYLGADISLTTSKWKNYGEAVRRIEPHPR